MAQGASNISASLLFEWEGVVVVGVSPQDGGPSPRDIYQLPPLPQEGCSPRYVIQTEGLHIGLISQVFSLTEGGVTVAGQQQLSLNVCSSANKAH